jgi:glycosyltransferase domain-containing protein
MNNALVSIVIPYHSHPETIDFLKRQLNYYHINSFPFEVIIAISGDKIIKEEIAQFLKELNDPRFTYFSTTEEDITNVKSFIKKIFEALQRVTTPYVVINGADDLLILSEVEKGIKFLERNADIAGIKGYTIRFYCHTGHFQISQDPEISHDLPIERLKVAAQDRDSIFYIIRRTKDLTREYGNIVTLSTRSDIVGNSLYHVEHFLALSVAALGKIHVMSSPWRLQSTHKHNHTSHTPASFIRIQLGILDKDNFNWFKSVTQNMTILRYRYYKLLWILNQIRGICITPRQIIYNFIKKKCSLRDMIRIFTYLLLNKAYGVCRNTLPERWFIQSVIFDVSKEDFLETKLYASLKKDYFSQKDISLIEPSRP